MFGGTRELHSEAERQGKGLAYPVESKLIKFPPAFCEQVLRPAATSQGLEGLNGCYRHRGWERARSTGEHGDDHEQPCIHTAREIGPQRK